MEHILEIGKSTMSVDIQDEHLLGVLHANEIKVELVGEEEVVRAIQNPIGSERLSQMVSPGESVVIITSDITRPMPSKLVIPHVVEELRLGGIVDGDITIVFALGSHRAHTEEEMRYLVGDVIYEKIHCIDSDMNDFIHLGTTDNGTPIDIFTPVAKADRRICLGNIEFHYFAGYSGGAKAIMPGVSTRDAIQANHRNMVKDEAHAGNLDTNPVRIDIEATINTIPIDFIVNVVLNEHKEIIKAVAGDHIKAHRVGCQFLDGLYKISIKERADIVIVSAGGFPKDLNLYQAQKALDNSKHAVKEGGVIILVASCKEGLGEHTFEQWLKEADQPDELITRIKKTFKLGGHKAAAIAMVLKKSNVYLVSDLDGDFVRSCFLEPFTTIEEAYQCAQENQGNDATVMVIPHGGSILPHGQ